MLSTADHELFKKKFLALAGNSSSAEKVHDIMWYCNMLLLETELEGEHKKDNSFKNKKKGCVRGCINTSLLYRLKHFFTVLVPQIIMCENTEGLLSASSYDRSSSL